MESLMRKYESIAFSAAAALTLFLTASCQKEIFQTSEGSASCTVEFSMNEVATKTAMGDKDVDNKYHTVWSSDDNARITFYQNGTASESVAISSADNYKHASFTASFSEQGTAPFTYKAILAGTVTANGLPVVPAEQHPTASSFDPDANVLVGLESEFASKPEKVDLVYKHAAVISRVCFTGIPDDLTIYGVQINAANAIAGAAKSVDYTNGTVDFSDASEKTISLIYDVVPSYSDGKFDAYFVAIPGTDVQINDIKLITDKGTFVKNNSKSSKTGFDVNKLKSVNVTAPSARTFYKATSVEAGQNYMIVSSTHALKRSSSTAVGDQGVSVNNDMVSRDEDPSAYIWTASASSSFTLKNGDYFINRSSSSISLKTSGVAFNYSNSELTTKGSSSTYCLYYSSSSSGWKYSTSSNKVSLFTSKLPAPERTIAFAEASASVDIANGTSYTSPSLIGVDGAGVSYSSSDENIATIGSNGAITLKKKGTVTITATASFASTPIYQSSTATASYELTVTNSNIRQFKKVTTPKSGGQYFIVSTGGYAMSYSSSKFSATQVTRQTTPEACIEIDVTKTMPTVWTFTSNSGKWKIASGSNQLTFTYSSKSYKLTCGQSGSSWTFNGSNLSATNNSKTGYLNISSTTCSASGSSSTIELYEYVARDVYFSKGGQRITSDSYNIDSGAAYVSPTVAGDIDGATITYSSSDDSIASVNSSTGEVTINGNRKTGTVTITANVAKTSNYDAATISYTITVTKIETYVKVTEAPSSWAGTYLILSSDDKKLFDYSNTTSGSSFHAASLTETITDNKIVSSDLAKYEVEIIAFDSSEDYEQPNKNGSSKYYWYEATPVTGWKAKVACESDTYIYSYGGDSPEIPVQTGIEPTSGRIYYNGFYFNDGEIKMISSRGTSGAAKYLGYHSSDGFYYNGSTSASTEPSERVHLYKKQ